jgi:hypothetical protein
MGILGNIAKRLKGHSQKDLDKAFYKKRDRKLNKAITAGKVPQKDLDALKTVRAQKDTPVKKKPARRRPLLSVPGSIERRDKTNDLIKTSTGG